MGLFSIFRRKGKDDVIAEVAQTLVESAVNARLQLLEDDSDKAAAACPEVAYALLHLVGEALAEKLSAESAKELLNAITSRFMQVYYLAVLKPRNPHVEVEPLAREMVKSLRARQPVYAKCTSVLGEGTTSGFPTAGSVVFAMCYFLKDAMDEPVHLPSGPLLAGQVDMDEVDLEEIPDVSQLIKGALLVGEAAKQFGKSLRHL